MFNLNYIEPVFRPPSEWQSLIVQVTNGCSWNECTYCEMYQDSQKQFSFKSESEILKELQSVKQSGAQVRRIFLADGDAMTLSYRRLELIMQQINQVFPDLQRVTAYCLPRNVSNKTVSELADLREKGLSMVYVGIESGSDEVLARVKKGETYLSSKNALQKLHDAGIKTSVMVLNGLGGQTLSQQHISDTAALMNETQPHYLSTLVVSFPRGEARFRDAFPDYVAMNRTELFSELHDFIAQLSLQRTIFRSDHASNWLPLKGTLPKDQQAMLANLKMAIDSPESINLRPEYMRGL